MVQYLSTFTFNFLLIIVVIELKYLIHTEVYKKSGYLE